ncbi:MAG TPA: hypothetical protein VHU40_08910, partial [Polyangia bacterium]|nr:hypothetical protein [Polyangia bacterium]
MPSADDNAPTPADPIAALLAQGDHVNAARLSVERGDLPRAIAIYERLWRFADALPLALRLQDRPLAIRLALEVGDAAQAATLAQAIPSDAPADLLRAAQAFAGRGRHWDAARLAERAGDLAQAGAWYRRAASFVDVGRMEEAAGRA